MLQTRARLRGAPAAFPPPEESRSSPVGTRWAPCWGGGGTSAVYRAWDSRLQRYVAIKRLEPPLSEDPHIRARFDREGRAIARLSHPNLVTLIDRGSTHNEEYMVFEYVEGRSLKDLIKRTGRLEPPDAGQIAGQVAEGLSHAHLAGIVHRDVKPQNILLDAEGRAKLTDFGIATGADLSQVTRAGAIVGSGRYMSPEQVQGRPVDPRSDLYSLGIVLYEMLAGEPPFQGPTIADIGRQHVRERPRPLRDIHDDIPEELERAVMRCLEKLPENRFQSMDELLGALVGLDLYHPQRGGSGIFGPLRRAGRSRRDSLSDSREWVIPPDLELPEPPSTSTPPPSLFDDASADFDSIPDARRLGRGLRRREIMATRRSRRRVPLWLPVLIVLAAVTVAVALYFTRAPDTPALVGLTLDEASAAAEEAGLALETKLVVAAAPPYGVVAAQEPAAGEAASGGAVVVEVTREPVAVTVTAVDDSDPEGDNEENPQQLPRLTDGDEETAWSTEGYSTAGFGDPPLKTGVGVTFALETSAILVEVVSAAEGWAGELQVVSPEGELTTVAQLTGARKQWIELDEPARAGRVWITALTPEPGGDGRYRSTLAELRFYR
ncbi:MAG: serine/threonine protein kinase [Thermoleophilia bacterium]|nr:serine/threonine protein kinase [Thermoleophilia bacterium]